LANNHVATFELGQSAPDAPRLAGRAEGLRKAFSAQFHGLAEGLVLEVGKQLQGRVTVLPTAKDELLVEKGPVPGNTEGVH
jgi:hypothetical protein